MHLVFIRLQPPFPCVVKQEIKMTLKLRNNKKKLRQKLASVALTSFPLLRNKSMNDNNNNNFQL